MLSCFITAPAAEMVVIKPLMASDFEAWCAQQDDYLSHWVRANQFNAQPGTACLVPNQQGELAQVLVAMADSEDFWVFGDLPNQLPPGQYTIEPIWSDSEHWHRALIAWGLGSYAFDRYQKKTYQPKTQKPQLLIPDVADAHLCQEWVNSLVLVRDLINTPTEDMSPEALSEATIHLARSMNSQANVLVGDELLKAGYPTIHAVGRGGDRAPCLIDWQWGDKNAPLVTLVGKGVCFDSGGLNLKPGNSMALMKKDMGGAAHALGLARMIITQQLPVRLRILIPAVENMVSGNSYRPGDIFVTRAGISVEVTNTDAEGRLVLCDALAEAVTDTPDLLIDFSTLTGAARVALGPEIPVFFSNQDALANGLLQASEESGDPLWRLPLYQPYMRYLKSEVADLCNSASTSHAGAITAGLYLKEFVPDEIPWAHFDLGAWNYDKLPGRPVGAEAQALRAVYAYLKERYSSS